MKDYQLKEGSSVILDLIRGVSAQLVVFGHGISFFGIFKFLHEPNFPWVQNIAVLVFFILSGFLISYSTVKKNKTNFGFKHYFIDRFSRIYSAFIPSIIFVLILDLISKNITPELYHYNDAFNIKTFFGNVFMFQDYYSPPFLNYKSITSFGSARPFWTLAIEWWIYMFFGYLMLVILKNKNLKKINLLILFLFSIIPIYNLVSGRGNGLTTYWFFGAIVYLISSINILKDVSKSFKIALTFIISGLALYRSIKIMNAFDPIFAFLVAILFWLIIDIFEKKKFSNIFIQLIRFNASFSFTLYLIHYSILDFIKVHFHVIDNPYLLLIISFITANIVSIIIGRFTEIRLTKKVKKYCYQKFIVNFDN